MSISPGFGFEQVCPIARRSYNQIRNLVDKRNSGRIIASLRLRPITRLTAYLSQTHLENSIPEFKEVLPSEVRGQKSTVALSVAAAFAHAQTIPPNAFSHIIIIIQENRTPDNLFGSGPSGTKCGTEARSSQVLTSKTAATSISRSPSAGPASKLICNISLPMNDAPLDPHHLRGLVAVTAAAIWMVFAMSTPPKPLPIVFVRAKVRRRTLLSDRHRLRLCELHVSDKRGAELPGTPVPVHGNLGASRPQRPTTKLLPRFRSRQRRFRGQRMPVRGSSARWVTPDPSGSTEADPTKNECYTHDSLVTAASDCGSGNCDRGFSWAYYTPTPGIIWNAPAGIPEVCYGENDLLKLGQPCLATEYTNHIKLPNQGGYDGAPILDDISNCKLQKITWVIPDQAWSDHPQFDGTVSPPLGPSWVGDIVDAIGNSYQNSLGNCDYWGYPGHSGTTPEPTAIFVVWDDWGGFFDHVTPPAVYTGTNVPPACPAPPAPNNWGCGYVYGFRVPLLVVSEYTQAGYVSGACQNGSCNNDTFPYQHDFGSILAFTEYNFGMPPIAKPFYADFNALDGANGNVPLSDFFLLNNQRTFTNISTPYPPSRFTGCSQRFRTEPALCRPGRTAASGEEDESLETVERHCGGGRNNAPAL